MKSDQTNTETAPDTPIAEFRNATKTFGDVVAANDLNLSIRRGEFLSFLGPSGCGKTTALRMLAGFEAPTRGDILLDGQRVNDLPPHRRPVNMVFQHYALFPHLTVAENISYGLRQQRPRPSAPEIAKAVDRALETVRLPGFGPRRIWEMSGGQQQRVALARAIINQPKLLLLDEPMAALDKKLRRDMQIELQTLQRSLGITFVLVTHDQEEALSMSDRICIMRGGRIVQVGRPRDLYDRPINRYVADFVGKSNFFAGRVTERSGGAAALTTASGRLIAGSATSDIATGQAATASLRPEQIALRRTSTGDTGEVRVTVVNRIFLGEHTEYLVTSDDLGEFLVLVSRQAEATEGGFEPGDTAHASWQAGTALILGED
ncbi:ABC transporter ATP-binding protein [Aliigemmobacter aestuarii]|uniref:Spermidine/putrescine import ATP-binding protein PotA n=1 Tax=Aliigemmobacter aestuarii TaxID=1445661 RepID=A0A4S3MSV1_9RHOB|nr:ABC transporter ATP-binding protein [Gemmobacter aestuarii]THD85183.1 ABC transporter ATP-binding protein [Gemmobacter aestuarii]